MIGSIRALSWLRWRMLIHAFRSRGGRDGLDRAARIGEVLAPVLLAVLLLPITIGLALLGALGGWAFAAAAETRAPALDAARAILAALTFAMIVGPILRTAGGAGSGGERLLLLPIPRRALLLAEILAGLSDPWLAVALPGILMFCGGILLGGQPGTAGVAVAATLLLVATLLALSATLAFVVQLLFRDRRRGEVLSLIGATVLAIASALPMLLQEEIETARGVPAVARALPSEMWGAAVRAASERRAGAALGAIAGLAATGGLLFLGARAAHRRLLEVPETGSKRSRAATRARCDVGLPGVTPAVAAVAWTSARVLLRTLSGRIAVVLNPVLGLILVYAFPRIAPDLPFDRLPVERGVIFAAAGAYFTLVSLGRLLLNQFAADGAGFTLQLLAPLSGRDLVRGKLVGGAMLGALSFALFAVVLVPLVRGVSPLPLLAVLFGLASAYLLYAPAAAILAAVFPKSADLNRMGSASGPHGLATFVGFFVASSCCAPPAALFACGAVFLRSDLIGVGLVALWGAIALAISFPFVHVAAAALDARRESVAMVVRGT